MWTSRSVGASAAVARADLGDRRLVVAADGDGDAVHVFDADALVELGVTPLAGRPGHVRVLESGMVAITLRELGEVVLAEPGTDPSAPLEVRCRVAVASEPWALAESEGRLLVTSGWGGALSFIDPADGSLVREIALPREPRSVLVEPKTQTAFVSHAVGSGVSLVDLAAIDRAPDRIDIRAGLRMKSAFEVGELPREASQGYGLATIEVRPGHPRVLLPGASEDPGSTSEPISSGGYGGGPDHRAVAPIVSVIDPVARRSITRAALGAERGRLVQDCLLPRGAAVSGERLLVACIDLDAVVAYDATVSDPSQLELARVRVPSGPTSVSVDDRGDAYVWSEIVPAVSRIDRGTTVARSVAPWRRSGLASDPVLARGRQLFHASHDARIGPSRACATCHPDGRDDGLVWTSPDGPRQTPSLSGRIDGAAPYGWFGESSTLKVHVATTLTRLGGTGMTGPTGEADLEALVAFVASLRSPPTRETARGAPVERGKLVFQAYGCQRCHKGGEADGKRHDIGSGGAGERHQALDTPTLRGVSRTAPYFHDGRYATLEDLLRSKDTKMIDGDAIEPADRAALAAFLGTL